MVEALFRWLQDKRIGAGLSWRIVWPSAGGDRCGLCNRRRMTHGNGCRHDKHGRHTFVERGESDDKRVSGG